MKKKAISSAVETILIILIVIASIPLLYLIVDKTIKQPLMSPQISCIDFQTNPSISSKDACYNTETQDLEVSLQRTKKEPEIYSIEFITSLEGNSQKWSCGIECSDCKIPDLGKTKTYYLNIKDKPESIEITINSCKLPEKRIREC